jgi:hypothetical protein
MPAHWHHDMVANMRHELRPTREEAVDKQLARDIGHGEQALIRRPVRFVADAEAALRRRRVSAACCSARPCATWLSLSDGL